MAGGWARDGAVSEQIEASISDELARMQDERLIALGLDQLGEFLEVLLHVDVTHRVVLEHPEEAVEPQIDR